MPKNKNIKSNAERLKEEFYKGMHELRKSIKELKERQERTDAQIDKLLKAQEKTDTQIDKLRDSVQSVSDGYGRFVEGIVSPSAEKYFSEAGYKVTDVLHRRKIREDENIVAEYDTIIETELNKKKYVFIGGAKTHCSSDDVIEFIKKIKKLRQTGRYPDAVIIGFVAAVSYGEGVDKYAIRNGLYVFKVTDEIMEVQVPPDFIPAEF